MRSLCPVIEATFWVATMLPVTRARNIAGSSSPRRSVREFPTRLQERLRLPCHHDFLVGGDGPDLDAGAVRGDHALGRTARVPGRAERDTEPREVAADAGANPRGVLADPPREGDHVGTAQLEQEGAQVVTDRGDE